MPDFHSNEELLSKVRELIERWCDERRLAPLSRVLLGYLALNGLTDGWANLLGSLKATRALGHETFSNDEWEVLTDAIRACEAIIGGR